MGFMTNFRMYLFAGVAAAALTFGPGALPSLAASNQQHARITMVQARSIALKAMPGGKIVDAELEKEQGGSGLRYSFDVKVKGKTYEVGVDAMTGKILEKSAQGAKPD